jgi:hypothetical protein
MKRHVKPVIVIKKNVEMGKWFCTFCGYSLHHFSGKSSGLYWCPDCKIWHHTNLALLGKGVSCSPFSKVRLEERKPGESLAVINALLNKCLEDTEKCLRSRIITYSSDDYDQEYLRSLVPSLNKNREENNG